MDTKSGACVFCSADTSGKLNVLEGDRQVYRHGDADSFPKYVCLL